MGQIIFNEQKPKYANKLAITTGTKANVILNENEIWLIDSTVDSPSSTNTKSSTGKGKYDKYIKGDGQTAAKNLPLLNLDPDVPTHLSQLIADTDHQTVSNEQISRWNEAAAGEGGTLIESSEDITVVNDSQQNINRLELANKQYNALNHSGLGKVYLRKNIQTVHKFNTETVFDSIAADYLRREAYFSTYKVTHDAKYKQLAEATDNTDAKSAANNAYTTAYNNAIQAGKTEEEAINAGNAAYVAAYKEAVKNIEGKDTQIEETATNTAKQAFESASAQVIANRFPQVKQTKYHYIDGRIQGSGDNRYVNINYGSVFSITNLRIDMTAGDKYRIWSTIKDSAQGANWLSRYWIVTETPEQGDTTAKLIRAYKEDGQNLEDSFRQESAFIEADTDSTLWINCIFYTEHMEPYYVERIYETNETQDVNIVPELEYSNTEYIVSYDYDLCGKALNVPENSVLRFNGGSIKNGYIKGNNSSIIAAPDDTIIPNVSLVGNWKNDDYYAKWFGAVADGVTDDTAVLQKMLDISESINKHVNVIWGDYTFKTTQGLYIKSNTTIKGGNIIASFENPLDWILQTRSFYGSFATGTSLPPNYTYIASWQEFDGVNDSLNHITNSFIYDLTLLGRLNKNMVIPEEGDETSEKVWDNTYNPIYGGLKINGGSVPTTNVTIRNVGIGIARGACLHSNDNHLDVSAYFVAYAARAMNTSVVTNAYLNAISNLSRIPYRVVYQGFNAMPRSIHMREYIEGNGGIDDSDNELARPKFCAIKMCYANILFNNTVTDSGAEVGFAAFASTVIANYPYFENVNRCYLYGKQTRFSINTPEVTSEEPNKADYDLIGSECAFTLIAATGRIDCRGGSSASKHKYSLESGSVQIVDKKQSFHPEDSRFSYLVGNDGDGAPIVTVSGNSLTAVVDKYYRFTAPVETLTVTLPTMGTTTVVHNITIAVTNINTGNFVTFVSADSKPIVYYNSYDISNTNTEYEISCMYNGTKWIIAAAVIG